MEQPTTVHATSNTIREAEQSGNIAKQRFARMVEKLEASNAETIGSLTRGSLRDIAIASRQLV